MGTIYKSGIPYSGGGGGGGEYTAGDGIKIENGVISGTKIDTSKGTTNSAEVVDTNGSKMGVEFGEDVVLSASSPMLFGESVVLQKKLESGTDIKTVNNESLLGGGNIDIQGGVDLEIGAEKWYGTYKEDGVTYQVYSKVLKIDALPATAGITNYPHGITGIKQILCAYGFGTNGFVLNAPRQNAQDNIAIYQVQKASGGSVAIEVGKDRSNMGAYVCLVYAKNN